MNTKRIYQLFGALSFLVTLIVYLLTIQPSTPFWDCGEFTAAVTWQQIPHPPGTALFVMVGKFFQLIFPFGDLNWQVNFVSVVATAFSVFFLYLITVKAIQNYRTKPVETMYDALLVYGSSFVGALAFCFSDTLWFNGVESEVYAATTVFTALVVYLMMRWNEVADEPGNERYLLLISYLVVLSAGIHLLAILTIYSVVFLVYFRKYTPSIKGFVITSIVSLVIFFFIYQVVVMWLPTMLAGHIPFKNAAGEYLVDNSFAVSLIPFLAIAAAIFLFYYGMKNNQIIMKLLSFAFLMMILGYTVNFHVIVRSNANPPLNENEPNTIQKFVDYVGRVQYGESKYWPRRFDGRDESKTMYYDKYGQWYPPDYQRVTKKDGSEGYSLEFNKINTAGELNYLWTYQINHMYIRYFLWNFVGRTSDVQDAGVTWFDKGDSDLINFKNGYSDEFPIQFFALPLIFGLIGFFYHFKRDKKMAFIYLIMFLLMGVLAAIAQNQLERQPRERDYFYTGSFMVFCMWIGIGVYSIGKFLEEKLSKKKSIALVGLVVFASLILVPVNMAVGGWKIHSRAGNYLPFDFAYNLLQSCEKDAIIFTVGDNDTFPLWNIQDVLGVRRDIRVVNLSLGGTRWYIHQLKNRSPWGAKPIPLTFSNESLEVPEEDARALTYDYTDPVRISIPVSGEILSKYTSDSTVLSNGKFELMFYGDKMGDENKYLYHLAHKLVKDIIEVTKFARPVYFSITAGSDAYKYGLGRHIRNEGMVLRVCPVDMSAQKDQGFDVDIMSDCLLNNVDNTDNYHTEPHYGFKFRNLSNPDVYYDEVHRRYLDSYRQTYLNFATYNLQTKKDTAKAVALLNKLNECISTSMFPLLYDEEMQIARLYYDAGNIEKAKEYAQMCVNTVNEINNKEALRGGGSRIHTLYDEITGRNGDGTFKSAAYAYKILDDYPKSRDMLIQLYNYIKTYTQNGADQQRFKEVERNIYETMGMLRDIDYYEIEYLQKTAGNEKAIELAKARLEEYKKNPDPYLGSMSIHIESKLNQLQGKTEEDTSEVKK